MSRKEKYETNNRRQQTFMSPEDVASGRKSSWQGVEINGELKMSLMFIDSNVFIHILFHR